MPSMNFQVVLTANQKNVDALSAWQYRYAPWAGRVTMYMRTTGATGNVTAAVTSGSQTIHQRSLMQVGGTAGVTPTAFTSNPVTFNVGAGDLIATAIDENAAATPTVDGWVDIEPL